MLLEIINKNYDALLLQLILVFVTWVIVLLSVVIDFYFGVQKSKQSGKKYIHSFGIRKSGNKLAQYFAVMLFMLFLDVINPLFIYTELQALPLFSLAGCAVWVWTERKSVMEKFEDKVRHDFEDNAKDLFRTLNEIRTNMKDVSDELTNLKSNQDEK